MSFVRAALTTWLLAMTVTGNPSEAAEDLNEQRELVNQGTVAVVGGSISGTYSKLVWDMSTLFDDGYSLRVLPILGKGSFKAIEDLLLLRGIDAALVQSDVISVTLLFAQPVGTVGDHDGRDAQTLDTLQIPEILPRTKGGFFLQRHLRDEILDVFHYYLWLFLMCNDVRPWSNATMIGLTSTKPYYTLLTYRVQGR